MVGARRVPGYSHQRNHISGLAAQGMPSAPLMVPGFLALGLSGIVMPIPDPVVQRLVRTAGLATIGAGLARCSSVDCPMPTLDEDVTSSDVAHSVMSMVAFGIWTAIPTLTAVRSGRRGYRRASAVLAAMTWIAFWFNSRAIRRRSDRRGLAQRLFFAPVFVWYSLTSYEATTKD